jgi:NADPH2:quinone reductase
MKEFNMLALAATGDPAEAVAIREVPEPHAGPGDVVVDVEAFSVNRGDAFALSGVYGTPAVAGWLPGQDIVGRVAQSAASGAGPAVGERVVGHPPAGGWAERVAVPLSAVAAVPDAVASLDAAALPLAGITALRLVRRTGQVPGQRLLLTGASGGVGHFVTELAALAGMEVTVVTASAERAERLMNLGAAQAVQAVGDAKGPFDFVLESVGGESFTTALSQLAPGGTALWYGQASLAPVTLDFFELFAVTPITIQHFPHWVSTTTDAEDLRTLVDLVATGKLHPEVGRTGDWADTASILTDVVERRVRGNAVLTITR